jgi:hypothetical protein
VRPKIKKLLILIKFHHHKVNLIAWKAIALKLNLKKIIKDRERKQKFQYPK